MPKGYSGTNSQGNSYNTPGGTNTSVGSAYHYSNSNGSYYYGAWLRCSFALYNSACFACPCPSRPPKVSSNSACCRLPSTSQLFS